MFLKSILEKNNLSDCYYYMNEYGFSLSSTNKKMDYTKRIGDIIFISEDSYVDKSSKIVYILEDKYNKIMEENFFLEENFKNTEITEGRVAILCDSFFFGNSSGIYTFLKHLTSLFRNLNLGVDFILERPLFFTEHILEDLYNSRFFCPNGHSDFSDKIWDNYLDYQSYCFSNSLEKYLEMNNPSLIIANSYTSTKALTVLKPKQKHITYTHIGDIMDDRKSIHDFEDDYVKLYLELLNNNDSITLYTQSEGTAKRFLEVLPNRKPESVRVAFEPFFRNDTPDFFDDKKGVLLITGNYKRKALDKVFKFCGELQLPLTLVSGNVDSGHFKIPELIKEYKIKEFRVFKNYPNKVIKNLINQHRILLHLSDIEVMPYSVIESIFEIPCIINGRSKWGQEFFDEAIKIDPDDKESYNIVKEVYDNYKNYKKMDYDWYISEVEKHWKLILEE